ncbi:adenylate/guanylate cyclase domain-containing protein [Novosphingobium sp. Gsoil 351]|uniref:adenylate/guanylate cyclase domain-containing protein n=1 Tax=Novosphingobium sp. Gsoil 351 TaxID=2675225 RepID=UPI0012B4BB89|nr:adenylate/guanylate cyclase domain-containing protein [Novosphingobium sp. Gsoil 351]QGN54790.1 GAF domain-containing protein [Novosphingobium sp. Gsoil 351]
MVAPYFRDSLDPRAGRVEHGVLDLTTHGPLVRPIELNGQWRLTWLGGPGPAPGTSGWADAPGLWEGLNIAGTTLPQQGRARYSLQLRGLVPGRYVLHVPAIYAASRITLDGRQVSQRGVLGDSAAATRYVHRAHLITFDHRGGPLNLAIDLAVWLHWDNGLEQVPVLGLAEPMQDWIATKWSRTALYAASLTLVAALSLITFFYRPSDRASLFFGLASLAYLPSMLVLAFDDILMMQFPALRFQQVMGFQYLTAPLAGMFFLLYVHELYRRESSPLVVRAFVVFFLSIVAVQAVMFTLGNTLLASKIGRNVFLPTGVASQVYVMGVIALAALRRRDGAIVQLIGMALFVGSFVIMALVWTAISTLDELRSYEFTALGAVMLLYSQVVILAERWSLSVARSEQDNDDLRNLLEVNTAITSDLELDSLLRKIVAVSSKITRADRSSLFLKQDSDRALTSLVAEGVEGGPLKLDAGRGLAGYVYATGQTLNIPDAYEDERFNRSVDEATGYRTRSVLTVPITSRDGSRIGVMQALNREDGEAFSPDDAARVGAFGAQAAVAIDNARLFSESVAARSFDESILRSMSGGVIALDLDWKITKLNAAAAQILGASATLLAGLDARSVLPRFNPRLVDEIAAVADRGEPKLLLDIEFTAGGERPSSVNLSITPLEGETGRVGVLLVIEDISEGKRLQGAMRRFMTQEVVDQVLGRDDDSLFGTACQASVLFADIRGFTTMAEELTARETVETLNELFTELYEAVSGNGGVLDKYIGDAVMAVFGAPLSSERDPDNAFAAGLEMLRMLDAINRNRETRGAAPLRLGVGIATGEVVAGTIGSPKRMDYTVIGDSVNLAARLQDLTKAYGVEMLIDEATAKAVTTDQPMREIDLIAVRGRKRPETVFEVLARSTADPAGHAAYAEGRAALAAGRWDDALAAFARAVELNPDDRPAQLMLARARALSAVPPPGDWDGVWRDGLAAAA